MDFVRNVFSSPATFLIILCFNPCFSGFCSECRWWCCLHSRGIGVSILVLVDFVRNEPKSRGRLVRIACFNPCFSGFCSECLRQLSADESKEESFNPCFSGFCSECRKPPCVNRPGAKGFNPCFSGFCSECDAEGFAACAAA